MAQICVNVARCRLHTTSWMIAPYLKPSVPHLWDRQSCSFGNTLLNQSSDQHVLLFMYMTEEVHDQLFSVSCANIMGQKQIFGKKSKSHKTLPWRFWLKAITRQSIELEGCSIPLMIWKVLQFGLKMLGSFGFEFFCGWRQTWGRFRGFLNDVIGFWTPTSRGNFLFLFLKNRQKFAFLERLIDPLTFVVWKWLPKNNKLIN